jgi:hypothetical protein
MLHSQIQQLISYFTALSRLPGHNRSQNIATASALSLHKFSFVPESVLGS